MSRAGRSHRAEEAKIDSIDKHWKPLGRAMERKVSCNREVQRSVCESPKILWLKAGMMICFMSQLD